MAINDFFNEDSPVARIDQKSYNKAIDDFVDRLEKYEQENWVSHLEYGINWSDIEYIAEQLKAGGKDE